MTGISLNENRQVSSRADALACSCECELFPAIVSVLVWIAARRHIRVPAIEEGEDARKQSGSNHGMAFARPMDEIDGVISKRNALIVHDHLDGASSQPACHLLNVGSALFHGAEETHIVAARLQYHDVGSIGHVPIDAAEHHRRRVKRHSCVGDLSLDALGLEQGLQLRRICTLVADVPAMSVACADRHNPQRRRMAGAYAHKRADGQQDRSAKAVRECSSERAAGSQFRSLSRLRFRLAHGQDRALNLGLDLGVLVDGHVINADVAA